MQVKYLGPTNINTVVSYMAIFSLITIAQSNQTVTRRGDKI